MLLDPTDLITIGQIADLFNVGRPAVCNWNVRYSDFPEPVWRTPVGNFYSREAMLKWYVNRWPDSMTAKEFNG